MNPALFDRIIGRSAFPSVVDVERERAKIDAVRIAVGAIMFWRTALIVAATYYYHPLDVAEPQITGKFLLGCGMLVALGAYTAGICTPVVGLFLVLTYPYFDLRLLTGTLGTNVASVCLIALLLLNTGSRYSVDAHILSRNDFAGRIWRTMYGVIGFPDGRQMSRIYILAFAAYAVTSFGALAYHISDDYWREGRTVGVMLTNAYLSRHYELFRSFESAAPSLYQAFSTMCVVGQSIFQFGMIPLMFAVWGRRFVVAWGLVFFAISLLCLQLSYLPYLELALWSLVFFRMRERVSAGSTPIEAQSARLTFAYTCVIFAAFALFLLVWLAPGGRAWSGTAWDRPQRGLAWFGLDAPQVFNVADLRMGERWPVIHRVDANGHREMVPLTGEDGERLAFHKTDLLYFGNSLRWHRRMIASDPETYNARGGTGYEQIREVCYYDYAKTGLESPVTYEVRIYENRSARHELPIDARYAQRELLAFEITIDPPGSRSGD